jgi:hypothetical protein
MKQISNFNGEIGEEMEGKTLDPFEGSGLVSGND